MRTHAHRHPSHLYGRMNNFIAHMKPLVSRVPRPASILCSCRLQHRPGREPCGTWHTGYLIGNPIN